MKKKSLLSKRVKMLIFATRRKAYSKFVTVNILVTVHEFSQTDKTTPLVYLRYNIVHIELFHCCVTSITLQYLIITSSDAGNYLILMHAPRPLYVILFNNNAINEKKNLPSSSTSSSWAALHSLHTGPLC